ncbi:hypothetical protein DPEC_G00170810 [Dallia pectoralis]|uniref:Uncharacterized protein n=1 Tax=Dallia pectoralis TaxID=75939 RepID=A0ACC2GDF7_DALPE|nr:hypothetical protein DPEC_G00170810 [Dallia pectoralis]
MTCFRTVQVILGLYTSWQETCAFVLGQPQLTGPSAAEVQTVVDFQCEIQNSPKNFTIFYQILRDEGHFKILGFYSSISGEPAVIPLEVMSSYEGNLVCLASVQNNTDVQPNISNRHHFRVIVPVQGADVVVTSGSMEIHEGHKLSLLCNISKGNYVSYRWMVDRKHLPQDHPNRELIIQRATPRDSGSYSCAATNQVNSSQTFISQSIDRNVRVKELVSEPELSFLVEKKGAYFALVTCQSLKGTLPITFSLYNRTELVVNKTVDEQNTTFVFPVDLELDLGYIRCQADNGDKVVYSKPVPIHIVPVGGALRMHSDVDVRENFSIVGLRFYCSVERGNFLRYRWFLNGTALEGRGKFYEVASEAERSILHLSVGRTSSGTYHCEVSNSFDNMTVIRSKARYIDKKVLNQLPVAVVAVVFGCFLFLVVLVTTCCFIGLFYRRSQYHVEKSMLDLRLGLEKRKATGDWDCEPISMGHPCIMVAQNDNGVDEEEYMEDDELVGYDKIPDSDQGESESIDEWPELQQELKKTLEDEDVSLDEP